jgi:hypothetical protein
VLRQCGRALQDNPKQRLTKCFFGPMSKGVVLKINKTSFEMKNILSLFLVLNFAQAYSQVSPNNGGDKNLAPQVNMKIEPLFPSQNYNECMGIVFDKKKKVAFFATNGKYIQKYNLQKSSGPKRIATIGEVKNTWNDDYGDTFVHEMKLGNDGFIYAVAENCILKINPKKGDYTILVKEDFIGPWGAYGLDLDSRGNIYVGDHHGGIHVYLKNQNWRRKTIIAGSTDNSTKKSFGGVLLKNDMIYYLDFENSSLHHASLIWKSDSPEIINPGKLDLPVPYPEFMQTWKGDIFVKAARENTMLRIRNNEVIQKFTLTSDKEVSPIVTFFLDIVSENQCVFYGMSWGPNGTLYRGELNW